MENDEVCSGSTSSNMLRLIETAPDPEVALELVEQRAVQHRAPRAAARRRCVVIGGVVAVVQRDHHNAVASASAVAATARRTATAAARAAHAECAARHAGEVARVPKIEMTKRVWVRL